MNKALLPTGAGSWAPEAEILRGRGGGDGRRGRVVLMQEPRNKQVKERGSRDHRATEAEGGDFHTQ